MGGTPGENKEASQLSPLLILLNGVVTPQRVAIHKALEGIAGLLEPRIVADAAAGQELGYSNPLPEQLRRKHLLHPAVVEHHLVVKVKEHQPLVDVLKNPAVEMAHQSMGGVVIAEPVIGKGNDGVAHQREVHMLLAEQIRCIQIDTVYQRHRYQV